jgi:hypothetical protein
MTNPRVFIASSTEGLKYAKALQESLEDDKVADCTIWTQDVFRSSTYPIPNIVNAAKESDYGIFIFSPDDVTLLRDEKHKTVRDNVILELGVFIGALGREHCFIVSPDDVVDFRIPTDLIGLEPLTFNDRRKDKNILAAMGSCANKLEREFSKYNSQEKIEIEDSLLIQIRDIGLSAFYSCRDDYSKYRVDAASIDKYINTAKNSIKIVSISLITGIQFDEVLNVIKHKLINQADFNITISLLNPRNEIPFMALAPFFDMDYETLAKKTEESLTALCNLKSSLPNVAKKRFHLKVHNTAPFGSAIMLDDDKAIGKIQIEMKPYKVGIRKSFAYEIKNNDGAFYQTIRASYLNLINDGSPFELNKES